MKRRSFHRPRWTGVTRTRRPANSLRAEPRSWQRRRARQSSSTRSAGHLRCDRAAGVARSLDGSSSAPDAAHRHARWRGWPRPGRRGAATVQKPAGDPGQPRHPPQLRKHLRRPPRRTNRHQRQRSLGQSWDRSEDARPARRARGIPENAEAIATRLLGTLPQPVFRQPEVPGLHTTDLPGETIIGHFHARGENGGGEHGPRGSDLEQNCATCVPRIVFLTRAVLYGKCNETP